jgi:hypothetical protein
VRGRDELEEHAQRRGGVEVVGERVDEALLESVGGRLRVGVESPHEIADAPHPRRRLLERRGRVLDRLAVVAAREVHDERLRPDLVERLAQQADVPDGLGHLLVGEADHAVVHPEPR